MHIKYMIRKVLVGRLVDRVIENLVTSSESSLEALFQETQ